MKTFNELFIQYFISDFFSNSLYHDSILDLGCGTQPYKKYYSSKFKKIVTADIEDRTKTGIDVKLESEYLPFENNSFDVILFTEVIEHIPSPNSILREINRVLKPGGFLVITFPFNYPLHELPNDYYRFTEFGMEKILNDNCFEVIRLFRRGNVFTVIHLLIVQMFLNVIEFFNRIPVIRFVLKPINYSMEKLLELSFIIHFQIIKKFRTLNPEKVGNELKGISGSFNQWTLGYCFIVRKKNK